MKISVIHIIILLGTCSNPGTCTPSGTLSCYNGMCTNPITPDQVTTSACFSYSVMSTTCTNFCACNANGVCYTPTGNPPVDTYRLISACDASGKTFSFLMLECKVKPGQKIP